MKIAVTGGNGFIGSYLVEKLLKKGYGVTVIDIRAKGPQYRKGLKIKLVDVEYLEGMESALQGIDVVYHLAGFVVSGMRKNPFKGSRLQLNGTLNVLEASRLNQVAKVILASSFYVYSGLGENIVATEETPLDIREMELFSASKLMAEALMQEYHRKYGLQYLNLRFGSAYGYGDCSNVIKSFIETGLEGKTIEIWGEGKRWNQYTYVDDIAEGCMLALSQANQTYNLISPQRMTTQGLAQLLRTKCGFDIVFDPTHEEGPSMAYLSPEKAITGLNWKPRALSKGIDDMMAKMYPNGWVS